MERNRLRLVVLLRLVLRRHQRRRRHWRSLVYVNLHRVPAGRAALVDVERTALPTLIDQTTTNEYKTKRSAAQVRLGHARLASGGASARRICASGAHETCCCCGGARMVCAAAYDGGCIA